MPDPTGLQYMPGGRLYGLNSPFITSNNPPAPSTTNKLGYLGLSGVNSPTYTPPPAGTATVDNPGTFVASQPLVENKGTPAAFAPGGGSYGFNPLVGAPGNAGGITSSGATSANSYGFNPIPGAGTTTPTGGKHPYQQSTGMPQPAQGTVAQSDNGLNYHSPQDQVANALFDQQQSVFSPYRPQGSGFFRSRF